MRKVLFPAMTEILNMENNLLKAVEKLILRGLKRGCFKTDDPSVFEKETFKRGVTTTFFKEEEFGVVCQDNCRHNTIIRLTTVKSE